jgi:hypothetical protein
MMSVSCQIDEQKIMMTLIKENIDERIFDVVDAQTTLRVQGKEISPELETVFRRFISTAETSYSHTSMRDPESELASLYRLRTTSLIL